MRQNGVNITLTDFSSILTGGLKKNVLFLSKLFTKSFNITFKFKLLVIYFHTFLSTPFKECISQQ